MNSDSIEALDLISGLLGADYILLWSESRDGSAIPQICKPANWSPHPFRLPDLEPWQIIIKKGPLAVSLLPVMVRSPDFRHEKTVVMSTKSDSGTGVIALWLGGSQKTESELQFQAELVGWLWLLMYKRHSVEKMQKRAVAELYSIAQSVPQGVVIVPVGPQQAYCNDMAARMLGVNAGALEPEIVSNALNIFISGLENSADVKKTIEPVLQMQAMLLEYDLHIIGGRVLKLSISPIFIEQRLDAWLWLLEDVTRQRILVKNLEYAKQNAESQKEVKSLYLSTMTHEIRSPLHSIVNLVYSLDEICTDPEQKRLLDQLSRTTNLLQSLVNDVLDMSKLEAGKMDVQKSVFKIADVLQDVQAIIQPQSQKKGLQLEMIIPDELPSTLIGDRIHLLQVLINLMSNAVKFTNAGGVKLGVLVKSNSSENYLVEFRVSDTGIGIAQDKLQSIFDPYTQAESHTRGHFGGTGLGLYISRELVELMGGDLKVSSKPGKGTEFYFDIRFEIAVNENDSTPETADPQSNVSDDILKGKVVLLAEDNELIRKLAHKNLERKGAIVVEVQDGRHAVDYFLDHQDLDLILIDMRMPLLSGLEAAQLIRNFKSANQLPIIAMTGESNFDDSRSESPIFNAILLKPFTSSDFYKIVRGVLEART